MEVERVERVTKRKSLVWNHFRESKDRRKAECCHCNQVISIACGSLGNLNRHLRIKHGLTSDRLDPGLSVVNIVEVRSLEETPDTEDTEQAQDGVEKLTADTPVVLAEGTSLSPLPSADTVKMPRRIFTESLDRAKKKKVRERDSDVDMDDDKFMSLFLKSKKQEFQESDELDLFFRSMCQTTKKMPLLYQIRVKKQIMNVVSQAEEELAGSTPGSETTYVVAS
ncbi:uncharacterized protein [Anabrus simplex]|uniref:uncharacterized protein n=1 Tax=Anabrus simplex TaxID=316456 RepID=UPI0035A30826